MVASACLLDVGSPPPGHTISCKEVMAAADKAGGLEDGDVVFLRTGWDRVLEKSVLGRVRHQLACHPGHEPFGN